MKINLQDKVVAEDDKLVKDETATKETVTAAVKTEDKSPITHADKIPSNWSIVEIEHGIVEAYNNVTTRRFSGNLQDFNKMLRG